jgi:RNA polymerase sigma-70 factor (ECF subfamily)
VVWPEGSLPLPDEGSPKTPAWVQGGTVDAGRSVPDAELMARLGRGDASALTELIQRHWKPVVCYASSLVDADTAEDIAQETFLRLSTHAAQWRPLGPVRAYVLRIARNLALNEQRKLRLRTSVLGRARTTLSRRSVPTPEDLLAENDLRTAIERTLAAMPERRREVFTLVRFAGLSYAEASLVIGTSPQTIANQMSSAMAELRRAIEPFQDSSS